MPLCEGKVFSAEVRSFQVFVGLPVVGKDGRYLLVGHRERLIAQQILGCYLVAASQNGSQFVNRAYRQLACEHLGLMPEAGLRRHRYGRSSAAVHDFGVGKENLHATALFS